MKLFLLFIILIFNLQSLTKADDIRDFEIEGMSIGDSLFEHFSKNVIENALDNKTYYKDKSFFEIFLDNAERIDGDRKAKADPSGKSYVYISSFYLVSGGIFNFSCTDYDKEIIKKRGWFDSFKVSIASEGMAEYLLSDKAY